MKLLFRIASVVTVTLSVFLSVHLAFPGIARALLGGAASPSPNSGNAGGRQFTLPPSSYGLVLEAAFPQVKITRPVALVTPPDESKRFFLVQQDGQVLILPNDESAADAKVFLDVSDRHLFLDGIGFDEGLLGFAFHPDFASNGKFYASYTQTDLMRTVISEFRVTAGDHNKADPATERVLLEIEKPFVNHNSASLLFGTDGFLYISVGDGGKQNDAARMAQNMFSLLGKILRIDVNRTQGSRAYAIPADNPFVGTEGARGEIFALGFRNPWGMSFDAEGRLWSGDVGQDLWEEVNVITRGGNYGWSFREGARSFPLRTDAPPEGMRFIDPLFEYPHTEGLSVTGGFFYKGSKITRLQGAYLFGDWLLGRIWALWTDEAVGKVTRVERIFESPADWKGNGLMRPTAFAQDAEGEVLVLDGRGAIFHMRGQ